MKASDPIRGLWCAALTPVDRRGLIEHEVLAAHLRQLLDRGVDGIVLFGTTGEGPSFSVADRSGGLEAVLASDIPLTRLAVATGCAAFADTLSLIRHALQYGCPRCLVLPPFFWKDLSDEAVFHYYASLIEAVGDDRLRLYLYHFPQLSGIPIRPSVVARLAMTYPEVIAGVKDSSGDFSHTAALLEHAPQLAILVGHEPHLPRLLRSGGAGTICGLANLYPELVVSLLSTNASPIEELRVIKILDVLMAHPFVPAFKAVLATETGRSSWREVRPPLMSLPTAVGGRLHRALQQLER